MQSLLLLAAACSSISLGGALGGEGLRGAGLQQSLGGVERQAGGEARARALLALAAGGGPGLNASAATHHCVVTADFAKSAATFGWLFGTAPTGKPNNSSWVWYRGVNTTARALLVHTPLGPPGWTLEIIQPFDTQPSFWAELLRDLGPVIQHFGVVLAKGTMDATRAVFEAAGFPTIQMGQGSWGCYAYYDLRATLGAVLELLDEGNTACTCPS